MGTSFNRDYYAQQAERKNRLMEKGGKARGSGKSAPWALRMEAFYLDTAETTLRIIPNKDGEIWYQYYAKWLATKEGKRQIISNAWNGERDIELPCVLYHYALEEEKPDYLANELFASTVVVMDDFYKIPKEGKSGNKYIVLERSKGVDRHGNRLDGPEYSKYELTFGRRQYWALFGNQRKRLMDKLYGLGDTCANCKKGEISVYAYVCPHCGELLANHKDEPIDPEFEMSLRTAATKCPSCKKVGKAQQLMECVVAKGTGSKRVYTEGCDKPTVLDLTKPFEITVKTQKVGNVNDIVIVDFNIDFDEIDPKLTTPYDFDYFLGKMDLDEQAKLMGKENPFDADSQKFLDEAFIASPDEEDEDSRPAK